MNNRVKIIELESRFQSYSDNAMMARDPEITDFLEDSENEGLDY